MNWGNAIVRKITHSEDGTVASREGELHLEGDFTLTKWKLTWLPIIDDLIPVRGSPLLQLNLCPLTTCLGRVAQVWLPDHHAEAGGG